MTQKKDNVEYIPYGFDNRAFMIKDNDLYLRSGNEEEYNLLKKDFRKE